MTYYVFSFGTRSAALAFYNALNGVCRCELVSTPVKLNNSCGLSVTVSDYDRAISVLRRGGYGIAGIYYYSNGTYTRVNCY